MDRRTFLGTGVSGCGMLAGMMAAGSTASLFSAEPESPKSTSRRDWPDGFGLPEGWRKIRKLDAHNHVMQAIQDPKVGWQTVESLVIAAEALGIEGLYCSRPLTGGVLADAAAVSAANDSVIAAMKRYPGLIHGFCFLQPGLEKAAIEELKRCLDAGMVGVKLYNQFKYNDPMIYPIAEACIEHRIPFLGHSAFLTDPKTLALQPKTSHALDFCDLASRYPELILILGHVNGGGDWEWAIKGLKQNPNVFLDTSGSVQEDDTIDRCVRELGHHRILFATDQTMEGGIGKILSADLTPAQREDIFHGNFQAILDRRKS